MITLNKIVLFFVLPVMMIAQTAVYPGSVVTDAQLKVALNNAQGQLSVTINSSVTTLTVSSCSPFVNNMLVSMDQEVFSVTSCIGTTMLVAARPFPDSGNVAASHSAGAVISGYIDAWHHNSVRVEVEAIETALGSSLANVMTPSTGVHKFNNRQGDVSLQSADVAAVEQDLRTSASPAFNNLTLTLNLGLGGTLTVGGVSNLADTLTVTCNPCSAGYGATVVTGGSDPGIHVVAGSGRSIVASTTGNAGARFDDGNGSCSIQTNAGLVCSGNPFPGGFSSVLLVPVAFADLDSPCDSDNKGRIAYITDGVTNTWGTAVTVGGGTTSNQIACNGTNWTITGK